MIINGIVSLISLSDISLLVYKNARNFCLNFVSCNFTKLEYFLTPYTKINSKWIKDLNVRSDTIKLLEKNIGRTLYDINHSKILFDPPPREMEIKTKINKWDL